MRKIVLLVVMTPTLLLSGNTRTGSESKGEFIAPAAAADIEQLGQPHELPQSMPGHAVQEALAARDVTPYTRWIWCPRADPRDFQAAAWALSLTSRSPFTEPPRRNGVLVRVDLDKYVNNQKELDEWVDLWEEYRFDPHFARLITSDAIKLFGVPHEVSFAYKRDWRRPPGGEWRSVGRRLVEVDPNKAAVLRFNGPVPERSGLSVLQDRVQSLAPIVEADYFVGRHLSTIKDRDKSAVFATVWGGLYHEFAGIRKSTVAGRTDLGQLLFDVGITEQFEVLSRRLRSEERAALFRSKVTGGPRRIVWIGTPAARLSIANGVIFITEDVRDADVDSGTHAVKNLDKVKTLAYEVIWTRPNGQLGYALFGADQELLDEAAFDVASDSRVPPPNKPRLQAAKSCIGCHGPYDGWQPFESDVGAVARLLDIFGERNNPDPFVVTRLKGYYKGSPAKPLRRAREDNAEAVLRAATLSSPGVWFGEGDRPVDSTLVAQQASARIEFMWFADRYGPVDAAQAMRDLGLRTKGGSVVDRWRRPSGPAVELQRSVPLLVEGEDVVLGGLMAGKSITRSDWMLSYQDVLTRAWQRR